MFNLYNRLIVAAQSVSDIFQIAGYFTERANVIQLIFHIKTFFLFSSEIDERNYSNIYSTVIKFIDLVAIIHIADT